MPNQSSEQLSSVFQALADPTRRAVIERLGGGPLAMSELAEPFGMALPSFSQHMNVLESSGLVRSKKKGRVRTFQLTPRRLEVAEKWIQGQRAKWERRLDHLDDYLLTLGHEAEKTKEKKT